MSHNQSIINHSICRLEIRDEPKRDGEKSAMLTNMASPHQPSATTSHHHHGIGVYRSLRARRSCIYDYSECIVSDLIVVRQIEGAVMSSQSGNDISFSINHAQQPLRLLELPPELLGLLTSPSPPTYVRSPDGHNIVVTLR